MKTGLDNRAVGILVTVLVLVGVSATMLARHRQSQTLGTPGVKLVEKPIYDADGELVGNRQVDLPAYVRGYSSVPNPVSKMEVDWLPKDTTFGKRTYLGKDGFQAGVSVVVMGTDRGSIHKPQICLEGQGWQIERSEAAMIAMEEPHAYELPVMKLTASKEIVHEGKRYTGRGIYVYWFVADGQLTPYHGERMWWMARDLIVEGVLQRWAYVAWFATCWPGQEEETFQKMQAMIRATTPEFQLVAGQPGGAGTEARL